MKNENKTFVSIAILKPKANKINFLRKELLSMITPTRSEPGCLEYILFEDESTSTFYMREEFKDQNAFDFHLGTTYFRNLAGQLDDLLAEPINVVVLNRISS